MQLVAPSARVVAGAARAAMATIIPTTHAMRIVKRIRRLEEARKTKPNRADIEKRLKAVNEIYDLGQAHPDYNKTRKRRTTK